MATTDTTERIEPLGGTFLTQKQSAAILGVKPHTLFMRLYRAGRMPLRRVDGHTYLLEVDEVLRLYELGRLNK